MTTGGTSATAFDDARLGSGTNLVSGSTSSLTRTLLERQRPSLIRRTARTFGPRVAHKLLQVSGSGDSRSWSDVISLLPSDPGVLSVDVFDTVLTRRISTDAALARTAARLAIRNGYWPGSVEEYLSLRDERAAMGPAQSAKDWFEGFEHADHLVENEAQLELAVLDEIAGAKSALDDIRAAGWKVVFLSDMHHGANEVRLWLETFDLALPHDEVISSSDLGVSKSQGDLFDRVRQLHGDFIHVGNQLWADVAVAGTRGIRPIALRHAESNRYERVVEEQQGDFGAVLAAAARRARLSVADNQTVDSEMERLGASVVGPVMVGFYAWAREQALESGHRSMAFLARDGRLPFEIAHALPEDHRKDLVLRYLEGSRRTWQLPAASAMGIDRWIELGTKDWASFLSLSQTTIPFESLLDRFGLNAADPLPAGLRNQSPAQPLDESQIPLWQEHINSAKTKQLVTRRSDLARDTLYRYLKSTELPVEPTAFVDIGWRGQMAQQMNAVLAGYLDEEPIHLHFGAYRTISEIEQSVDIRRFAIHDNPEDQPVDRPVSCLESIAASGGPKLVDLIWTPDGADPVFSEAQPEIFGSAKQSLWAGAKATAARVPSITELEYWGIESQNMEVAARELLRLFWMTPSATEAAAFSRLSFETDDDGRSIEPVARPYELSEILSRRTHVDRQWRRGSIELAKAPLRPILRAVCNRMSH